MTMAAASLGMALVLVGAWIGAGARARFGPDDFAGDWYGWVTNQAGHIALGVLAVWVVGALTADDLPSRWAVLALALAPYLGWEVGQRGGWIDSAQDVGFYALGASGVALNWPLDDPRAVAPWVGVALSGLALGGWVRRGSPR
jgi:hypothetical protein